MRHDGASSLLGPRCFIIIIIITIIIITIIIITIIMRIFFFLPRDEKRFVLRAPFSSLSRPLEYGLDTSASYGLSAKESEREQGERREREDKRFAPKRLKHC